MLYGFFSSTCYLNCVFHVLSIEFSIAFWKSRNIFEEQDDVIKWKRFPRYWPFVREIHRSSVDSPHKGQWRGAWIFFFDLRLHDRLSKQSRRRWLWYYVTITKCARSIQASIFWFYSGYFGLPSNLWYKAHHIPKLKMFLASSCSCLCPIQFSKVSSREWRCSWLQLHPSYQQFYWWAYTRCLAVCNILWKHTNRQMSLELRSAVTRSKPIELYSIIQLLICCRLTRYAS